MDELNRKAELLLPGALLMTIQAQLLAAFMFINFGLRRFLMEPMCGLNNKKPARCQSLFFEILAGRRLSRPAPNAV